MADRRVRVILEAQIAQFQQGMRAAQAELGNVAKTAGQGEKQMGGMGTAITGKIVPAIAGMVSGFQAFDKVVKGGFERFADLEDAEKRLRQMGLSTGEINTLMAGLTDTVTDTAFALNDGAGIMAQFVAAGMDIDEVNDRLTMTADTAAFAQAPLQEIGDIFVRIQSEGRLTGETLNMLQVRGVPALQLLADTAGVSGAAMRDMISRGVVDADRFFDLWETGSRGFGENNIKIEGAAKSMGDTVRGALANAETALARLGEALLDDFMPAIRAAADETRTQVDGMIERWDALTGIVSKTYNFLDEKTGQVWGDFRETATGAAGDVIGSFLPFKPLLDLWSSGMELVTGDTEDAAKATGFFGDEADRVRGVIESYLPGAEGLAGEMAEVAEETAAAAEALSAYQDALKIATSPVLGLIDAVDKVDAAQRSYNEAVKKYGGNSAEARDAALDLFEATVGLESAAHNADLSFAGVNQVLADMVAQGALTAEQAAIIGGAIDEARGAAEDYSGPYTADLLAEIDDPAIRDAKRQLDAIARMRSPRYRAEVERRQEIQVRNRLNALAKNRPAKILANAQTAAAERNLNYLARPRSTTISVNVRTYGNLEFHRGGLVPGGGVPRFHEGGMAWPRLHSGATRLASDEFPAILQAGERVLSRRQNVAFERLMRMLGNTAMGGAFRSRATASSTSSQPSAAAPSLRQIRGALDGMTLVLDDRRGRTVARIANLYGRGG